MSCVREFDLWIVDPLWNKLIGYGIAFSNSPIDLSTKQMETNGKTGKQLELFKENRQPTM